MSNCNSLNVSWRDIRYNLITVLQTSILAINAFILQLIVCSVKLFCLSTKIHVALNWEEKKQFVIHILYFENISRLFMTVI
jgi:hypothetical protein